MGRPDINNLNDLKDYLSILEDRIAVLEQEDRMIKGVINEVNHNLQTNNQPADIPTTGLLNRNFFTPAFTVWWHYFMASFIIGLVVTFIYLAMFVAILGNSVNFGRISSIYFDDLLR
jgi:hypothetical protein